MWPPFCLLTIGQIKGRIPPLVVVIKPVFEAIVIRMRLDVLELEGLPSQQLLVGLVIFYFFTGSMCRHNFDIFLLFDAVEEKRMIIEGNC